MYLLSQLDFKFTFFHFLFFPLILRVQHLRSGFFILWSTFPKILIKRKCKKYLQKVSLELPYFIVAEATQCHIITSGGSCISQYQKLRNRIPQQHQDAKGIRLSLQSLQLAQLPLLLQALHVSPHFEIVTSLHHSSFSCNIPNFVKSDIVFHSYSVNIIVAVANLQSESGESIRGIKFDIKLSRKLKWGIASTSPEIQRAAVFFWISDFKDLIRIWTYFCTHYRKLNIKQDKRS